MEKISLIVLVLALAPSRSEAQALKIMAMGDSITVGVDYYTQTAGGYRDPLLRDLTGAGISFIFVGANTSNATPALTAAGETAHNGYGSWHIVDLDNNLDGVAAPVDGGDSNLGGYFLTGGHGTGRPAVSPDILLLHVGANDILQETPNINQSLYDLVTHFHTLSPNTIILVAGLVPINAASLAPAIQAYNAYIKNTLVPSLPYTVYVDQNSGFLNSDGSVNGALLGIDNIHPDRFGYPIMGLVWARAIEQLLGISPTTYPLTVANGAGTGSYPAGSVLTIGANTPASGTQFASWSPSTTALTNPYAALTLYVTPAAASTLTASYDATGSPIIPDGTYQINSLYDSLSMAAAGNGDSAAVQQQTYKASSTQKWSLTNLGGNNVTLMLAGTNEALEVAPALAATVEAPLDIATYTGAATQQWTVNSVYGGTQLVNVATGQSVTVDGYSTSPGSQLVQFTTQGSSIELWQFYPLTVARVAIPAYSLTVNNGTGSGSYAAGSAVAISANAPLPNFRFSGWAGAIGTLADPTAASTTLTMPAAATVVTATYAATYTLAVNGGSGSGTYTAGTVVPVTANAPASGYRFSSWSGSVAALASVSSASTTLTMPASSASITAVFVATTTSSTPPSFATMSILPTGASAAGASLQAATADYNGDGYADIATTNTIDASVSILLGKGNGSFSAPVNYAVGNGPYGVVAGDFNGDGKPDLAIVNGLDNTVSILINSAGTFPAKPTATYTVGSQPYGVSMADLNDDGTLDLVVTNNASDTVSVLLGNGNGSFQTAVSYPTGRLPFGTAIADLNGDGYPDLAVWNGRDNTVGILLNDKTGAFLPQTAFSTGVVPFSIAAGDFNGDGYPDLATANLGSNTVSVLLNNKAGGFATGVSYATGALPTSALAVDLNNDGILDLATTNLTDGTVSILLGKGDGTFVAQAAVDAGIQPYGLLTADFNGDGRPDVAVTNFFSNSIGVLLQTAPTTAGKVKASPPKSLKLIPLP